MKKTQSYNTMTTLFLFVSSRKIIHFPVYTGIRFLAPAP